MSGPIARLENFSESEKNRISSMLRKKMILRSGLIGGLILLCACLLIYFNIWSSNILIQENRGVLNVVFGVVGIISARLLLAEVMEFWSESNAAQKKVVNTRITGRKGEKIFLGKKSFGRQELLLDDSDFDLLKEGDAVKVEYSTKSDTLFSVKKIQ
jgi:hypothetical protein